MVLSKLLPHDQNFYELLDQHAACIVTAARAFSQMVANYADPVAREKFNREVDEAEQQADGINQHVSVALRKTFITPIARDQIHQLIDTMDDVVDLIQDCTETMSLYDIHAMTPDIVNLTEITLRCCEALQGAIEGLPRLQKQETAAQVVRQCARIDELESEADQVQREAMSRLFRQETDVRELIKLKAVYEVLESVSDRCEDVAKIVEGVVLENS